jgi:hypothetical protein
MGGGDGGGELIRALGGGAGGGELIRAMGGAAGGGAETIAGMPSIVAFWLDNLTPQYLQRTASIGSSRWQAGQFLVLLMACPFRAPSRQPTGLYQTAASQTTAAEDCRRGSGSEPLHQGNQTRDAVGIR